MAKKAPYPSPLVISRRVADVSSLPITELPGLFMSKISASKPRVLVLAIFLVVTLAPSMVILELKKLLPGLAAFDSRIKPSLSGPPLAGFAKAFIRSSSFEIPRSPSRAATPKRVLTGPTGIVVNPATSISTRASGSPLRSLPCTPLYPSKVVMYLPGNVGFSYTTTSTQPAALPPSLLPLAARILATKYSPLGFASGVSKEVTSATHTYGASLKELTGSAVLKPSKRTISAVTSV